MYFFIYGTKAIFFPLFPPSEKVLGVIDKMSEIIKKNTDTHWQRIIPFEMVVVIICSQSPDRYKYQLYHLVLDDDVLNQC